MIFLTSTTQSSIVNAESQIADNCDLPNNLGTARWALVAKAIDQSFWFIVKPPIDGWGNVGTHFTQAQMMAGIDMTGIIEQESNSSWFPYVEGA